MTKKRSREQGGFHVGENPQALFWQAVVCLFGGVLAAKQARAIRLLSQLHDRPA
jgi:hypothetical protein